MIFLNDFFFFFFHREKLFSLQFFLKLFSNMFAFIAK